MGASNAEELAGPSWNIDALTDARLNSLKTDQDQHDGLVALWTFR